MIFRPTIALLIIIYRKFVMDKVLLNTLSLKFQFRVTDLTIPLNKIQIEHMFYFQLLGVSQGWKRLNELQK